MFDAQPYVVETETELWLRFDDRAIQSRMVKADPYHPGLLPFAVMLWGLLLRPQPRRVANIGLGGGGIAKWCWRHLPSSDVRVVEINPGVIALRDRFLIPPDSDRFRVIEGDGAEFISTVTHNLDFLVVDGADLGGVPPQLCSDEFYEATRRSLVDEGVAVFNLEASSRLADRISRIRRIFGGICWWAISPHNGQVILFAQRAGRALWTAPSRQRLVQVLGMLPRRSGVDFSSGVELFSPGKPVENVDVVGGPWRCQRSMLKLTATVAGS